MSVDLHLSCPLTSSLQHTDGRRNPVMNWPTGLCSYRLSIRLTYWLLQICCLRVSDFSTLFRAAVACLNNVISLLLHHVLRSVSTTRVDGPLTGVKNAPEFLGRQLGSWTRAVNSGSGNRPLVELPWLVSNHTYDGTNMIRQRPAS